MTILWIIVLISSGMVIGLITGAVLGTIDERNRVSTSAAEVDTDVYNGPWTPFGEIFLVESRFVERQDDDRRSRM